MENQNWPRARAQVFQIHGGDIFVMDGDFHNHFERKTPEEKRRGNHLRPTWLRTTTHADNCYYFVEYAAGTKTSDDESQEQAAAEPPQPERPEVQG